MIMVVENTFCRKRYKMPVAPRYNIKATKIAYKVMGVPANIQFRRNAIQRKINRRLVFEETSRVR